MDATFENGQLVPLADALCELNLNRERVLRRIQAGELRGARLFGRWFVYRKSLEEYTGRRHQPGRAVEVCAGVSAR